MLRTIFPKQENQLEVLHVKVSDALVNKSQISWMRTVLCSSRHQQLVAVMGFKLPPLYANDGGFKTLETGFTNVS